MECYEGATMIKTFRGLIVDGAQDTIVLHTNNGSTGYRVVKFEGMPNTPGAVSQESVLKIYSVAQTTFDNVVDFSNNTLLGVLFVKQGAGDEQTSYHTVFFDNMIFNQDIYITHKDTSSGESCNYYIELEQVKLDLSESTVATLKDIRNEKRIPPG